MVSNIFDFVISKLCNSSRAVFFSKENAKHSFEKTLIVQCHFSRMPQIGLMSVARFSWVPNLYNLHFLLEIHRPQPNPVNSYRDHMCVCVCVCGYYTDYLV